MQSTYCCQCGRARLRHEAQMDGYYASPGIIQSHVVEHRPLNVVGPQLLAHASVYRNGGTDPVRTHICHRCIAVALRKLLEIIQADLADFEQSRTQEQAAEAD